MANPMMIMMVIMLIVVVGMPKLLQGMSPEELQVRLSPLPPFQNNCFRLKELQKQSQSNGDPMKNLQKLMGMGGPPEDEDE